MISHLISRVVERRFVLETEENERFRTVMCIQENFTGCEVISNSLNNNYLCIMLEAPSMVEGGLSVDYLFKRLSALYGEDLVAGGAKALEDARTEVCANEGRMGDAVEAIKCDRLANRGIVL